MSVLPFLDWQVYPETHLPYLYTALDRSQPVNFAKAVRYDTPNVAAIEWQETLPVL